MLWSGILLASPASVASIPCHASAFNFAGNITMFPKAALSFAVKGTCEGFSGTAQLLRQMRTITVIMRR